MVVGALEYLGTDLLRLCYIYVVNFGKTTIFIYIVEHEVS